MGRRITKARAPSKLIEDALQFGASRNDHTGIDGAQLE